MGFFGGKPAGILGIDVGASSVKLVEIVREKNRARLRTYGFTEWPEGEGSGDRRENVEEMGAIVRELRRKSGAQAQSAIASIPTFSVFSSIITLPELPKKELPNAIQWEAKKLVPFPLEEMILNWEVLSAAPRAKEDVPPQKTTGDVTQASVVKEKEKKSITVLMTAAQKQLVAQYVAIFKAAGLELKSLETEAFALVRSLVGNDKATIMVVDIGAKNTDLSIIDGGLPVLNRSIEFGGKNFTDVVAQVTKLPPPLAEQLKRDVGRGAVAMPKTLEPVLAPLINEIQYTRGLYQSREGRHIEKIILTGGAGLLCNLAAFLTERFNTTVAVGDPWARVATPLDLAPALVEIGPRMSVAAGLAMREL